MVDVFLAVQEPSPSLRDGVPGPLTRDVARGVHFTPAPDEEVEGVWDEDDGTTQMGLSLWHSRGGGGDVGRVWTDVSSFTLYLLPVDPPTGLGGRGWGRVRQKRVT